MCASHNETTRDQSQATVTSAIERAAELDELGERSRDLRGRLLRQVKQGHGRSIGRYRVLMQAATIRRGRCRRWLLLPDNLGSAAASRRTAPLV
jgi:hypothetical protein